MRERCRDGCQFVIVEVELHEALHLADGRRDFGEHVVVERELDHFLPVADFKRQVQELVFRDVYRLEVYKLAYRFRKVR